MNKDRDSDKQDLPASSGAQGSEREYRRIVELASDVAYTADAQGYFTYVNPTAERLTGYPSNELIGMRFTELIPEEWQEHALSFYLKQVYDVVPETTFEFPIITKDGNEKWVEQKVTLQTEESVVTGFQAIVRDITDRRRAEEALARHHKLLQIINRVQSRVLARETPQIVFDEFLSGLLQITDSEFGFIGEVLFADDGAPYLKTHAITNIAWNAETRKFYEEHVPEGMEFRNLHTLFGAVMTSGKPVLSNDPANDPRSGGLPKGHPRLNSFLGLPFHSGRSLLGMMGIANRPGGYNDEIVEFLIPLMNTAADIVRSFRTEASRKAAITALEESETRNRSVLDNALDGIILADEQGLMQSFNPAAERIFGYTADEVIGKNLTILMPEPYANEHDGYMRRYLKTNEARIIGIGREVRGRRKNGSVFPLHLSVSEMHPGTQRLFIGMVHDLTDQKRVEEDRNRFFSLSLDMLCIANFDGYFVQLNPAWEKTLGHTLEELLAKPFVEYVHPDDQEKTLAEARTLEQGGETIAFENRYQSKDGDYRWFLWTAVASPDRQLIYAVARDITDLKRTAEELRDAKEIAEAANLAKSKFLTKMSHELRTPLNSVIGFANVLMKNRTQTLTEKDLTYLERISANGQHLLDLINDLLDLSKIEAGKLELDLATVAIEDIIQQIVAQLGGQAHAKNVDLQVQLPAKIATVETDERKLYQVLLNLVGNALKFTEKGSITIAVHADPKMHRPYRIDVTDTGIGIAQDRLETIFEPFQQADSSTSRKFGGTGLGLAISRSLCELMGYRLTVSSDVGIGSTFSIHLGT